MNEEEVLNLSLWKSTAALGGIALFCISEDPLVVRPLLVTVREGDLLWGELFLCPDKDRSAAWVSKFCFTLPHSHLRSVEVKAVPQGTTIGTWR